MSSYQWYDNAGRQYQMSKAQVVAAVKKYKLPKRKIYGQMAVDSEAWDALMQSLSIPLAPGYRKITSAQPSLAGDLSKERPSA